MSHDFRSDFNKLHELSYYRILKIVEWFIWINEQTILFVSRDIGTDSAELFDQFLIEYIHGNIQPAVKIQWSYQLFDTGQTYVW